MKMKKDSGCLKFVCGVAAIVLVASALNWEAYQSGRVAMLPNNLATPHSGEDEVLPEEVRSMLYFLRQTGVKAVAVSPAVAENRFVYQPLVESIAPAVVTGSSNTFIAYSSEALPAGCVTLQLEKGMRIAHCR